MGRETGKGDYQFYAGLQPATDRVASALMGHLLAEWRPDRQKVPTRPDLFARYIAHHWNASPGLSLHAEPTEEPNGGRGARLTTDQATFNITARSISDGGEVSKLRFDETSFGANQEGTKRGAPLVLPVVPNTPLSICFSADSLIPGNNFVGGMGILGAYTTMDGVDVRIKPFVRDDGRVGMQLSDELMMLHDRMGDQRFVRPVPRFHVATLFDEYRRPFDPLFFLLLVPQRKLRPDEVKPSYPSREESALLSVDPSLTIEPGRDGSPAFPLVQRPGDDRSVWNAAVPLVIKIVREVQTT